jgi:acetyl-CoA carboxylase biotin carboxyl carrier protein
VSNSPVVEALVEQHGDDGEILVLAPAVGLFGGAPGIGEVLVGGSRAGRLTTLNRTSDVVLPQGASGRVAERMLAHRRGPVEHGQVLLRLLPVEAGAVGEGLVSPAQAAGRGLPEGAHAVVSPTHGMFYRRPRTDAPAYVEPGQVVEKGTTMALVEVMKCFSAIAYGGEGLPPRAEVIEVRAEDGAEVAADQVLFIVRAAGV